MDPVALAGLLKDYGPWGLLALALLAVWKLYGDKGAAEKGRLDDAKAYAVAAKTQGDEYKALLERCAGFLERAAICMAAVTAALESRTGHFERLGDLVEEIKALIRDLERDSATADERLREKLDANAGMLRGLLERVEAVQRDMPR